MIYTHHFQCSHSVFFFNSDLSLVIDLCQCLIRSFLSLKHHFVIITISVISVTLYVYNFSSLVCFFFDTDIFMKTDIILTVLN